LCETPGKLSPSHFATHLVIQSHFFNLAPSSPCGAAYFGWAAGCIQYFPNGGLGDFWNARDFCQANSGTDTYSYDLVTGLDTNQGATLTPFNYFL